MESGHDKPCKNEYSSSSDEEAASGRPTTIGRAAGDTEEAVLEFVKSFNEAFDMFEPHEDDGDFDASSPDATLEVGLRSTRSSTGRLPPPVQRFRDKNFPGPSSEGTPNRRRRANQDTAETETKKFSRSLKKKKKKKKTIPTAATVTSEEEESNMEDQDVELPSQSSQKSGRGRPRKARESTTEEETELHQDVELPSQSSQKSGRDRPRKDRKSRTEERAGSELSMSIGRVCEGVYIVENLVDVRIGTRVGTPFCLVDGVDYRVKWEGWDSKFNSWEVDSHIETAAVLNQFWRKIAKKSQSANRVKSSQLVEVKPIKDSTPQMQAVANLLIIV